MTSLRARIPGLATAVGIAAAAVLLGTAVPLIGAPVSGVVLGVLVAVLWRRLSTAPQPLAALQPGLRTASKLVLQLAVVLLGAQLSLRQVVTVGWSSLPVMLGTLVACLGAAHVLGRLLGVDGELRTLVGVGTGICGASAIAAITPVIRAQGTKVAYALSTVFLFNIAAVLLFPPLGHLLGMSQESFALFAGTAVNDTSSVVAAAATYGPQATNEAVVVKLVRTLMIIPISIALALLVARRDRRSVAGGEQPKISVLRMVPWFLVGFLLLAAVNSLGLVPAAAHGAITWAATFFITVALAAIGLSTDLAALRATGHRPLVLGGLLWVVVTVTAIGLQALTGTLG